MIICIIISTIIALTTIIINNSIVAISINIIINIIMVAINISKSPLALEFDHHLCKGIN